MVTNFVLSVMSCISFTEFLSNHVSESVWWSIGRFRVLNRALHSWGATSSDCVAGFFWVWYPVAFDCAHLPFADAELQTLSEGCHQE